MMFEAERKMKNVKLIDRRRDDWFYCIAEDGTIFKFSQDYCNFYYLDLTKYVWLKKQSLFDLIFDTFLKYQEFHDFKDYFDEYNE